MEARDKATSVRVLVIEDDAFTRGIVGRFVSQMPKTHVTEATDGREALARLNEDAGAFDLIISDFNMPHVNGLELLRGIRVGETGAAHDVLFFMLTSMSDQAVVGTAIALDIDAFVFKPVARDRLQARISHVLGEDRALHVPRHYQGIDVGFSRALTGGSAEATAPIPTPAATLAAPGVPSAPEGARRVTLETAPPGAVLACDIPTPQGDILLDRGVILSERLITMLKDLEQMNIVITELWIDP